MKKNDWFILTATFAYTFLFYEQTAGLNFFIFSVLLVALSAALNKESIRKLTWQVSAVGTLLSGFGVFYLGTGLAVRANLVSLLLLSAFSFNASSSLFVSLINALFSFLSAVPYIIIRAVSAKHNADSEGANRFKRAILFMYPLFAAFVFFLLYRASNPLFANVTNLINFDFISMEFILFTLSGFVLMSAFFYHQIIKRFSEADSRNSDILSVVSEEDHRNSWMAKVISQPSELFTGISFFALLNLLLLSVNGIDTWYLYILQQLPADLSLSEYLHDGTNALIFSIVLAIGIIVFYFRGRLNFIENNKVIKALAYLWIAQNIFLIITIAKRNWFYVSNFGLTQKRIGVYVFLALCIIGLVTTFIKVYKVKSTWFLFRKNTWVWYGVLVAACLVNWDWIIADHNLNLAMEKGEPADGVYLSRLSYGSLAVLYKYYAADKKPGTGSLFDKWMVLQMQRKYAALTREVSNADWQSACLLKIKAQREIESLTKNMRLPVFTE